LSSHKDKLLSFEKSEKDIYGDKAAKYQFF